MERIHYVYITTNLINGKKYIGQRLCPKNKTIDQDSYLGSGVRIIPAIKKYGKENFSKEIIFETPFQLEVDKKEIELIAVNKCLDNGHLWYNLASGGQHGRSENHAKLSSDIMKKMYLDPKNIHAEKKKANDLKKYVIINNPISRVIVNYNIYPLSKILPKSNCRTIAEFNSGGFRSVRSKAHELLTSVILEIENIYNVKISVEECLVWYTKKYGCFKYPTHQSYVAHRRFENKKRKAKKDYDKFSILKFKTTPVLSDLEYLSNAINNLPSTLKECNC